MLIPIKFSAESNTRKSCYRMEHEMASDGHGSPCDKLYSRVRFHLSSQLQTPRGTPGILKACTENGPMSSKVVAEPSMIPVSNV